MGMSGDYARIARCLDLQEHDIAAAVSTREGTKSLLDRLAEVSAPDSGVAKVLLVYARMATTACDWADGDLCVDLAGKGTVTTVEAFTELGGGLRERLFAPISFRAPLGEFSRAIQRVPHMIAPLAVRSATEPRIRLSASEVVRRTTAPPPPISISSDSLFVRGSSPGLSREVPQPPAVSSEPPSDDVDTGWDD
jgi:hypothetical protein